MLRRHNGCYYLGDYIKIFIIIVIVIVLSLLFLLLLLFMIIIVITVLSLQHCYTFDYYYDDDDACFQFLMWFSSNLACSCPMAILSFDLKVDDLDLIFRVRRYLG